MLAVGVWWVKPSSAPLGAVAGQAQPSPSHPRLPSFFQRLLQIRPPCILHLGAGRAAAQRGRSGAAMLCTQGCWDHRLDTPLPPSPAQRVPMSLEPWDTQFWEALIPESPQAMETHPSERARPLPSTAHSRRTSTCRTSQRRMTPGVPPALHLQTRTRRKRVSSSGSPFPSPG